MAKKNLIIFLFFYLEIVFYLRIKEDMTPSPSQCGWACTYLLFECKVKNEKKKKEKRSCTESKDDS
jgi:hypothetical protein